MPLFTFECQECRSAFEALVTPHDRTGMRCPRCGGRSVRNPVSAFRIGGRRSAVNAAALQANGREFVGDTDRFVSAMDTFGERIGDRLSDHQMERAVERVKTLRR